MTFFQVAKRQGWKVVDPLRDARECPECQAAIYGREARRQHREMHIDQQEFRRQTVEALRWLMIKAGVDPAKLELDGQGDEDLDDRLTRKAQTVAAYDDDEEDDEP